jgi:transcriptional regulator with XRE-family HTH domain
MPEAHQLFYAQLGDRIRERRRQRQMNQTTLGSLLGLSRTTVVNIEKGRQRLAVHQLAAVADCLGCQVGDLIPRQGSSELPQSLRRQLRDANAIAFVSEVAATVKRE